MADTSFRFGTDVNGDDYLLSGDDEPLDTEEEEYDALNDETFGTLEDSTIGADDWEQGHEQFAEIAECSKHVVNSLEKLEIKSDNFNDKIWSYTAPKNGVVFCNSILSGLQKIHREQSEARNEVRTKQPKLPQVANEPLAVGNQIPQKFCTVEELERKLLQSGPLRQQQQQQHVPPQNSTPVPPHYELMRNVHRPPLMHPPIPNRFHMGMPPPPHLRYMDQGPPRPHPPPPGMYRFMPPPGLMYPPVNHPFNFLPPPRMPNSHMPQPNNRNMNHHMLMHNQYHYRNKMDNNNHMRYRNSDEYSGLMTSKEKQWLINIQLLQLNTGTPYFDDYYYTIFKERKLRNAKENQPPHERPYWQHVRRNSDRQESQNTLTQKTYMPLQFENSLGKLQCSSVTAPRKIIDMDIVTPDKDQESTSSSRDTKKIKQQLLELEVLYTYMLKAEDLRNPLYKTNMEKLCEIKQKQRLRELDTATTTEKKQEILKLLQQESTPLLENPQDYLAKVVQGLFQDDKYIGYWSIRKGKVLLLRVLPHLSTETYAPYLPNLWKKLLSSIPVAGRKDTDGDQLYPRFHQYFKRYILGGDMDVVLDLISCLKEEFNLDNSRSTPLSCQGKSPLEFVLQNKFGVSALATMLVRVEYLITFNEPSSDRQSKWFDLMSSCAEIASNPKLTLCTPIEPVPLHILNKHLTRTDVLGIDKIGSLKKCFGEDS